MNKIKSGDKVIILSGSHKKQTGVVQKVLIKDDKVVVGGINIKQKVVKTGEGKKLVPREYPIHISNVALVDPKTGTATRVGFSVEGDKKVRVARKSGMTIK